MTDKFACTHCGFIFEDPDMEVCPRCGTELGQEWDPAELRSFVITELTGEQAKFVAALTASTAEEILAVFRSDGCFALENLTPRQVEAYAEFLKQEGIPFVAESEEQKAIRLQKQLEAHTASQNAKAAQEQAKANADAKAAAQANAQAENDAKIKAEELARAQMADAEKTKISSAAQIEADRLRQLELEKIKIETEAKAKIAIAEANAREAEAKLELKKLEQPQQSKLQYPPQPQQQIQLQPQQSKLEDIKTLASIFYLAVGIILCLCKVYSWKTMLVSAVVAFAIMDFIQNCFEKKKK